MLAGDQIFKRFVGRGEGDSPEGKVILYVFEVEISYACDKWDCSNLIWIRLDLLEAY